MVRCSDISLLIIRYVKMTHGILVWRLLRSCILTHVNIDIFTHVYKTLRPTFNIKSSLEPVNTFYCSAVGLFIKIKD